MAEDMQTQMSNRVEREVRMLIGDLQMQVIVLRQMLELAQSGQQPQPQPQPGQQPPPIPPQPEPPAPKAANGSFTTRGA